MNLFPLFQTVLYTISTILLTPVVVLLIGLCLWMIVYAGGFLAEWTKRKKLRSEKPLADYLDRIRDAARLPEELNACVPQHIVRYAADLASVIKQETRFRDEKIEDLNQRKAHLLLKGVERIRLVVRIGPSLGLMGTLIPMGSGLAGLTQGNMAQLSSNLILAFTTTVVGLALGICAHFFSVMKEQWLLEDMRRINLITEAMAKSNADTHDREASA